MKRNWKRCINCLLFVLAIIIILSLAYAINLGMKQQDALVDMNAVADRIMINVELLEADRIKLEKENRELRALEKKTTEDMEGLEAD